MSGFRGWSRLVELGAYGPPTYGPPRRRGRPLRGRRRPIHGGLTAASLLRTSPEGPTPPPGLSTVANRIRRTHTCRANPSAKESEIHPANLKRRHGRRGANCERWGPGMLSRGCAQHGCCGQAPMDGFTATPDEHTRPPTRTTGTQANPAGNHGFIPKPDFFHKKS